VTRILLVRHGQSTWNAAGRWQGWADPPLSAVGEAQARAASHHVRDVDAVCASDLQRARRTAELLTEAAGLGAVQTYRGLRERGVGEFEGLTNPEIAERFPDIMTAPGARPLANIPGAEALAAVVARALAALDRIATEHRDRTVLAVSHGGLIRSIERHLGIEPDHLPNLGGRWLDVEPGGRIAPGHRVCLHDPDEAPRTVPSNL
jgi:broad specificity phosphatase PhoE